VGRPHLSPNFRGAWLSARVLTIMWFAVLIASSGLIPLVIVRHDAVRTFPPTAVVVAMVIVGRHPVRARVGRTRPVAVVPHVMLSLRIPVTFNPVIAVTRLRWYGVRARSRRRANLNADRHLRVCDVRAWKKCRCEYQRQK
jgi:hypothetical protein